MLGLEEYHCPTDLPTALELLQRPGIVTRPLAGGTELVATADESIQAVVDLRRLGLDGVSVDGGWLRLGAMHSLEELATGNHGIELLATAARLTAARTVRHAATVGGVLAGRRAGGDLTVALLALGARITVQRESPRTIDLAEFLPHREEVLAGGLITEIAIAVLPAGSRMSWQRVARTPRDRSIVSCAVVAASDQVRVALEGVAPLPVRLDEVERLVREEAGAGGAVPEAVAARAEAATRAALTPPGDLRGSSEYRRHVAGVLVRRALLEVFSQGGGAR